MNSSLVITMRGMLINLCKFKSGAFIQSIVDPSSFSVLLFGKFNDRASMEKAAKDAFYIFDVEYQKSLIELREKDAERFRWLLNGNGYFMEEHYLCGHESTEEEQNEARRRIDEAMANSKL